MERIFQEIPFWFEGPEFLKKYLWPSKSTVEQEANAIAFQEEVKQPLTVIPTLASTSQSVSISKLINLERFESEQMLLRTFAWLLRFIDNCRLSHNNGNPNLSGELSNTEIETAEFRLVNLIQREMFTEEYRYLSKGKVGRTPLRVSQFNMFLYE